MWGRVPTHGGLTEPGHQVVHAAMMAWDERARGYRASRVLILEVRGDAWVPDEIAAGIAAEEDDAWSPAALSN